MTFGGDVWAEGRAAERNPAKALLRLADDPRLALSPQEKEYLRQAARRVESEPRMGAVHLPAARVEYDPAAQMEQIAKELGQLTAPAVSSRAAEPKHLDPLQTLTGLKERLEVAHERVLKDFAATADHLRDARLPKIIQARHEVARADYLKNIQAVFLDLDVASKSQNAERAQSALAAAAKRLSRSTNERPQQKLDPSRLPFRAAKAVARNPAAPPAQSRPGNRRFSVKAAVPPAAADLAANEDVQITPEIQSLAASLGNQAVRIYDWVRNNVEYVPTYGSVQGSQMTLVAKRGNAFDTASLLIALLRASGVPARYVTGTIEVPAAMAMNWVGGAETPRVAQQLLGQGGVPNFGFSSGGSVTAIRIDHVWAEAFLDYVPSRGIVQGQGDTWVPMDPSFKLHDFTPRSNLFTEIPIGDVWQPGDHLFDADESLGKITNVDDQLLSDRLVDWAARSDEYIYQHGAEATVNGLVGVQTVLPATSTLFAGALPYHVVTRGTAVSSLPDSVRHSVTLNGYASELDRATGAPAFSVKLSLPALNSRRLGIEFDPATQADADTLAAARRGGGNSLPVYLVNVVPVIKLDGVEQGRGGSVRMGGVYPIDVVLQSPEGSTTVPYQVVAGDEIVAGITGNGLTREVIEKRFAENPVNNAPEYLHQVGLHYWMECDYLGGIAGKPLGVHMQRLPSVGLFSSPLTVSYLFGAPRAGIYESRIMDVKQSLLGAAGADGAKVISFVKQAGAQGSYLEGSVFDQLEGRAKPAIRGISSIHLIAAAAAQGVPIYRITSANSASVLPLLQLSSTVESDISTAVSQGKTVMVPEKNINIGPWGGVGYIVQDETTGAGAYLISGGANGGGLLDCHPELVPKFVQILELLLVGLLSALLIAIIVGALPELLPALAAAGVAAGVFTNLLLLWRGLGALSSES